MTTRNLILATAGHVDHGKTALIKVLTGVDTDRLPEEKARGITIDLGFAHLALPGFSLGIIDVPGHEDFVRNMIAGLGAIDLALFVVAADDGWMPQSEEHLQILDYLGVRHGVVAITKCDLGDGEQTARNVQRQLRGTSLGESEIVLTSIKNSSGIDELKAALGDRCRRIPATREIGKPRLFVDRAFSIRGAGTIVTGTLTGGTLTRGDIISVQPQNLRGRARALQSHNQSLEMAAPSSRVAVNLPNLRVEEIPRGSVLTRDTIERSGRTIDALLTRSVRLPPTSPPLKSGSLVHVHYGSARLAARVKFLDRRELQPGEKAIARLVFDTSLFAFVGDRFILRDASARHTLAGGLILDPETGGKNFRSEKQRNFLAARANAPNDLTILLRSQLNRDGVAKAETLLRQSNFSATEIDAAIDALGQAGQIFRRGEIVADANWWKALFVRAEEAIDAEHAARPNQSGLELTRLRAHLRVSDLQLFDHLVDYLCENGFERAQSVIRRRTHRPSLAPQLQQAAKKIRAALAANVFDPPSKKELIRDASDREALRFLCAAGEVVQLSDDVVITAAAFAQMRDRVIDFLRGHGGATTSELRQSLGTTRRVLVPLLERLDRLGLTIRQGDRRLLREAK